MKNNHSFLNWQGNNLQWHNWFNIAFLSIAAILMIVIFLLKDRIYLRFQKNNKILFFKNDVALWKTIGYIGLTFALFKTIWFIATGYPLYWTNFNLHICRIHIIFMFSCMAAGKFKWIKYITYIAAIGAILGLYFGTEISTIVNTHAKTGKTWDEALSIELPKGYKHRWIDQLIYQKGFTFFNVGLDNWWVYDFVLAHLSIIFFPMFIRAAYATKMSKKEVNWTAIIYIGVFLVIWTTNVLSSYSSDPAWRTNNWYVGNEKANDNLDSLGWISNWPENLFTSIVIGGLIYYGSHFLWMFLDKFHFFTDSKMIKMQKSRWWIEYKKERSP